LAISLLNRATSGFGVPAGAIVVNQKTTSKPGSPDYGLMYLSGGDWGYINGAGAPQGSGTEGQPGQLQRLDTLAGTILRIDPRSPAQSGGQPGIGNYTIPPNNPFVDGNLNTLDEIYAFGLRNGHRMMWDTNDGSLYVTNVGHANLEEIEKIVPGGNYGWPLREGTFVNADDPAHGGDGDADHVFVNNVPNAQDVDFRGQPFLYPVAQYDHGEGASIAGGFVYHGQNVPQLYGKLIFGDIVTGRIFVADMAAIHNVDTANPTTNVLVQEVQLYTVGANGVETNINDLRTIVGNIRADLRYGIDSKGEIYVMTKTDGYIRKLVGVDALNELVLQIDPVTGVIGMLGTAAPKGVMEVAAIILAVIVFVALMTYQVAYSRLIFVSGLERHLPRIFTHLNPRTRNPVTAVLIQGVLSSLILVGLYSQSSMANVTIFLQGGLSTVWLISGFFFLFPVAIARKKYADRYATETFWRIPGGMVGVWITVVVGTLGTIGGVYYSFAKSWLTSSGVGDAEWMTWVGSIALGMIALGVVVYFFGRRSAHKTSAEDALAHLAVLDLKKSESTSTEAV